MDGESLYNRGPVPIPRRESYRTYGPVRAGDRILELMEEEQIPCTFFIPGQIGKRYPDMVREIGRMGYEIGFHGYDHEKAMFTDRPEAEWRKVIARSQEVFQELTGKPLKGFCATSSDFEESAFAYSFAPAVPKGMDRISGYRGVLSNWKHEFDGYYENGLCMVFMLHPHIIGTPGRFRMLRELIRYMKEKPDVWFATGEAIADWWQKTDGKEGRPEEGGMRESCPMQISYAGKEYLWPENRRAAAMVTVEKVARLGHEIALHGYEHENFGELEPGQQEYILEAGIRALEDCTRKRPAGFRLPEGNCTPETRRLLADWAGRPPCWRTDAFRISTSP